MYKPGSISNIHKVISITPDINKKILSDIVYHIDNDGVYFLPESVFKYNISSIIENEQFVKTLTKLQATEKDYDNFILQQKIVVEPYEIRDPSTPESIIPMVF